LQIFLGKVNDQWAAVARDDVEPKIDAEAVIADRAIDMGLGRGEAGELAA
jgi:hypothetical protein